jgi:predicted nucleotidyltransferase
MMRTESNHPTPYPDVNAILTLLFNSVQEILGNQLVGMYLYGSLSSGDFDSESSDIDFLVVTTSTLSDKAIAELRSMHQRIWKSGLKWSSKLEGSYIPKRDIRRHDTHSAPCPTVNEGKFYLDKRGSDWIIQRHVIREQGIVLTGPDPKTLIDPVSPEEIRRAVKGILQEWWLPMLEDPSWLKTHGGEYHAFAILTMCRALHALEHGTIVSKPVAARWAQKELGERWSRVIERALARQAGYEDRSLYKESLEFIQFTTNTLRNSGKAEVH